MCFKKSVQIVRALKLNGTNFEGRALRIQKWESKETLNKKEKKSKKTGNGREKKGGKVLDTSRPTNNPLIKKIREKTNRDTTIPKEEYKKKYREKFGGNSRDPKEKQKKKKAEYLGRKIETSEKKGKLKKKKKALAQKTVRKIAKILTGKKTVKE